MDEGSSLDDSQTLPADDHVHSEWSWDAAAGAMEATCARAIDIGLPSLSFTEHADFTNWTYGVGADIPDHWARHLDLGLLRPPRLDVDGYLACLERCRDRFPVLSISSGVELGEPHWHAGQAEALLEEVNSTGALGEGVTLRFKVVDDETDQARAITAAEDLINDDEVVAVLCCS